MIFFGAVGEPTSTRYLPQTGYTSGTMNQLNALFRFNRWMCIAAVSVLSTGCPSVAPVAGTDAGTTCGACAVDEYCCLSTSACKKKEYDCTNEQSCEAGYEQGAPAGSTAFDDINCVAIPVACDCIEKAPLEHGLLGQHSAVAATSTGLAASGYEERFGDLVYLSASFSDLSQITVELVDGVPTGATPTHGPSGWRKGVSKAGDDVGTYTDIAVGADGNPVISYYDADNKSLKFAQRTTSGWSSHTVALPSGADEIVGTFTSIVIWNGKPAIAFLHTNISDGASGFKSEVKMAFASSASPTASTDWQIQTADSGPIACRELCGAGESCFLKGDGTSVCAAPSTGCTGCLATEECRSGTCTTVLAKLAYAEFPQWFGLWIDAVSTSTGPALAYYDALNGTLNAAVYNGSNFSAKTVAGSSGSPAGAFPSIAVDTGGTLHVTHQNPVANTLHYLQLNASTLSAGTEETIDDGLRSEGKHSVGADSALVANSDGTLHVIYQDQQNSDLLSAQRLGAGSWSPLTPGDANLGRLLKGGNRGYGFYSDMVTSSGQRYGSSYYYDLANKPQGYLEFFMVP